MRPLMFLFISTAAISVIEDLRIRIAILIISISGNFYCRQCADIIMLILMKYSVKH